MHVQLNFLLNVMLKLYCHFDFERQRRWLHWKRC